MEGVLVIGTGTVCSLVNRGLYEEHGHTERVGHTVTCYIQIHLLMKAQIKSITRGVRGGGECH